MIFQKSRPNIGAPAWQGQRKRHSRGKILLSLAALLFLAWLAWHFFGTAKDTHKQPATPVTLAPAVRKDIPVYLDGLGTVQASNTVTVRTQVDGQLLSFGFEEGQAVKKGDVLARIDPRTYQAQLDQAKATKAKDEATLANARVDLQRYINLGTNVSGQTVDTQRALVKQLEATIEVDQAAISNATTLLSYTTITSPINGRTGIQQVDPGNIVHAADANGLVVLTQLQPIDLVFSLPQQNLLAVNEQLAKQETLQVVALGSDGKSIIDTGKLELVDNQIDQTTGTIRLKATFPNEKSLLWPGGFVNVRMLLTTKTGSLVIPTVAVQRGPQGAYVFVTKDDGDKGTTVDMRPVKVDMTEDQDAVISDGLTDGEQVVVEGMAKLQAGSKVTDASKQPKDKPAADSAKPDADKTDKDSGDKPDKGKHHHKKDTE